MILTLKIDMESSEENLLTGVVSITTKDGHTIEIDRELMRDMKIEGNYDEELTQITFNPDVNEFELADPTKKHRFKMSMRHWRLWIQENLKKQLQTIDQRIEEHKNMRDEAVKNAEKMTKALTKFKSAYKPVSGMKFIKKINDSYVVRDIYGQSKSFSSEKYGTMTEALNNAMKYRDFLNSIGILRTNQA